MKYLEKIKKIKLMEVVLFILLFLFCLSLAISFIWTLISSLKSRGDFLNNPFGLPKKWFFSNYITAFNYMNVPVNSVNGIKKVYLEMLLFNSLIYSAGCAFFATITPCICAYLSTKFKYKLGKIVDAIVLFVMIMPIVGGLPSEIRIMKIIGFYDNMLGIILSKMSFLGMYYLVFESFFAPLPKEYMEAGLVDGASHYRILFQIMLPLVKKSILIIFVLNFIVFWNDYQAPMIFLPSTPTAAYGLYIYMFSNANQISSVPLQLAGCVIVTIPILILFLIFQDKMIGNVTMGGIKG